MDKIIWVFKTKLTSLNQPKLIIAPRDDEYHLTCVNELGKVEVKYHFINQNELYNWLEMLQSDEDPDKSMKKILKQRNKG